MLEYRADSDDGTTDGPAHQYDLEKPRKYMSFKHFFLILRARWLIASSILVAIVLAVLIVVAGVVAVGSHARQMLGGRFPFEVDLTVADFLDYMVDDPATGAILLFIESVRAPQKFIAAARKLNPDDETIKSLVKYVGQMAEWQRNNR